MKYVPYTKQSFIKSKYYQYLSEAEKETFAVMSSIFHFKANNHIFEHFIDWNNLENDPMYKMIFPRKEMIPIEDFVQISSLFRMGFTESDLIAQIKSVCNKVSPQLQYSPTSIPQKNGKIVDGIAQIFTKQLSLSPLPMMRTCHSYCTYCFRRIMFDSFQFQQKRSYSDPHMPVEYLRQHPEITDVLFTGADPMTLPAKELKKYIVPILAVDTVKVIRISTKALSYWPYRFTSDRDSLSVLNLFEHVVKSGKHLTLCAHVTHVRELENKPVEKAVKKVKETGAIIRCQGPIVKGINDSSAVLSDLWNKEIALGMIPYYLFIEANHTAESCFKIPLSDILTIFNNALKTTTPLARTVRGPVFMNDVYRILLDGVITVNDKRFFVLKNLQAPPRMRGEGDIVLIPYSENILHINNLFELFANKTEFKICS